MKKFDDLTQGQIALFWQLMNEVKSRKGVAGILKQYKSENQDSYTKDIEAVLTVLSRSGLALLSSVVFHKNLEALKDILNAVSNIEGLDKKILTEVQYKGFDGKYYTLLDYAKLYMSSNEENPANKIVEIIDERIKVRGFSIPQKSQDQAAGSDPVINSPESPSFLSQHGRKFAIIGTVALVSTIAAFMFGYPLIGVIIALSATSMLATKKGREMCDKLYDVLIPECFKSQKTAYSGV